MNIGTAMNSKAGPLDGVRVIELAGLGPGPFCGQLLSDMGADVILVERPGPSMFLIHNRGKRSLTLDLRKEGAAGVVLTLAKDADILIEGMRPGVAERLGVGPDDCRAVNGKIVYGRMTGWGQTGPWAPRAGHDINYVSVTGALEAMGTEGTVPPPPLNLVGDYGGGSLFLLGGLLAALVRAQKTGEGDVIDAAIVDGTHSLMGVIHSLAAIGAWTPRRGDNLLDGGAPFYRCYRTRDGRFMAAGAIEPQFLAEMLRILDITPEAFGGQHDRDRWPEQHAMLERRFLEKTRDEWAALFDGTDACVTPVLSYEEAADHPHNRARRNLVREGQVTMPGAAPRFGAGAEPDFSVPRGGEHGRAILSEAGYSDDAIDGFIRDGVVSVS